MPLYEYVCLTCGHEFEKIVRFSESGQTPTCPTCQSFDTRKRLSIVASCGAGSTSSISTGSSCGSSGGFS